MGRDGRLHGVLWSVFWLFKLITGKDGMGHGDFKLLAMLGRLGRLADSAADHPAVVAGGGDYRAWFCCACARQKTSTPIPFGPYLAIAGWIALLWGGQITDFYWQFVGLK